MSGWTGFPATPGRDHTATPTGARAADRPPAPPALPHTAAALRARVVAAPRRPAPVRPACAGNALLAGHPHCSRRGYRREIALVGIDFHRSQFCGVLSTWTV